MINKLLLNCLLIACLSLPIYGVAASIVSEELGTDAHTISLANIQGFSDSASVIWENPASLKNIKGYSVSMFHSSLVQGMSSYTNLSFGARMPFGGVLAAGYCQNAINSIHYTGKDSGSGQHYVINDFDYKNIHAKLAYQLSLDASFSVGAAANYFRKDIYTTVGSGYNVDLGLFYGFDRLAMSLYIKNLIPTKMKYYTGTTLEGSEELPMALVPSFRYQMDDINLYVQIQSFNSSYLKAAAIEYRPALLSRIFSLAAGWREYAVLEKRCQGINMGIGLFLNIVNMKFSYEKTDYQNQNNYYFSVDLNI